jgi:hypothetical protein
MNLMIRNLFLSLCLLVMALGPVVAFAQPKLKIASIYSQPADTVYYPNTTTITYRLVVENVGNNQLTGPCDIKFRYNSYAGDHSKEPWNATNFEVGETDSIRIDDPIGTLDSSRYKGGGNILIIWPNTDHPGVQAPDTVEFDLVILDITGFVDPSVLRERIDIYPNPVGDVLNLRYLQLRNKVEYVRILGIDGRVLTYDSRALDQIDTRNLPSGMYMLDVKYTDGMEGALRFTKQD